MFKLKPSLPRFFHTLLWTIRIKLLGRILINYWVKRNWLQHKAVILIKPTRWWRCFGTIGCFGNISYEASARIFAARCRTFKRSYFRCNFSYFCFIISWFNSDWTFAAMYLCRSSSYCWDILSCCAKLIKTLVQLRSGTSARQFGQAACGFVRILWWNNHDEALLTDLARNKMKQRLSS